MMNKIPSEFRGHVEAITLNARERIGNNVTLSIKSNYSLEEALMIICMVLGRTVDEVKTESRQAIIVEARQIAIWICNKYCHTNTVDELAKFFNRHRALIYHSVYKINDLLSISESTTIHKIALCEDALFNTPKTATNAETSAIYQTQ